MEEGLYYTAPSDESFADMKQAALSIWNEYEDPYRTEKVDRIKDIKNLWDNFMYIFAMFDPDNQRKCVQRLKEETKKDLLERLKDGGTPEYIINQMGL